jgi:replicative DNA helicase
MDKLTPQDLDLITKVLIDPVAFAKYHFDWDARWYQAKMLKNQSLRKVSRCGRRVGKTDAMCVDMIWRAFTNNDYQILVATPYETQVKVIFDRIRALIKKSPEVQGSIKSDRKHPDRIIFKNGSILAGFTAGTKSGSGGGSMRGQTANFLYLDEMDYLSDEDVHTITTIASQNKKIGIWASSTPSGKRGKFYEYCVEAQQGKQEVEPGIYFCDVQYEDEKTKEIRVRKSYTAFYFPSTVNPDWDSEMEAEWRLNLSEEAYDHEILANFGHETIGVFNKEYLDRARKNYDYVKFPTYETVRFIGVDWDKQICPYEENCWKVA